MVVVSTKLLITKTSRPTIKLLAHSCLKDYLVMLHVFLQNILKTIPNHKCTAEQQRVPSFGVTWISNSDPRSLGSWCIKGTDESTLTTDSSLLLMHQDPNDIGSLILIQIPPKEHTQKDNNSSAYDSALQTKQRLPTEESKREQKRIRNTIFRIRTQLNRRGIIAVFSFTPRLLKRGNIGKAC